MPSEAQAAVERLGADLDMGDPLMKTVRSRDLRAILEAFPRWMPRGERPTEPGWYWVSPHENAEYPARLWSKNNALQLNETPLHYSYFDKFRFAGPLPLPLDSETGGRE